MGKRQKTLCPGPLLLQGDEEFLTDDAAGKGIYPPVVSVFAKRVNDNDKVDANSSSDKGARIYSATEKEWVREHLGTLEGLKLPEPASIQSTVLKEG